MLTSLQPPRDHLHLPRAFDLRAGPDLRLVRLPGRVPALERAQEAEALRRVLRPHPQLLQRHHRLFLRQGLRIALSDSPEKREVIEVRMDGTRAIQEY